MKTILAILLIQFSQAFATCPTSELHGSYRAIPNGCEDGMFKLGFVDVIPNGEETQMSFFASDIIWPVVVMNYRSNSDQDPNYAYQCLSTPEEKIIYHPFLGSYGVSLSLKDGKYTSHFFGCDYKLERYFVLKI